MELKCRKRGNWQVSENTFNRTAYGIEINNPGRRVGISLLLIAPLMELKLEQKVNNTVVGSAFNRTAYGIEMQDNDG